MRKLAPAIFVAAITLSIVGAILKALILVLLIIVLAGLIFRTKQIVSLFLIGWLMDMFDTHPFISIGLSIFIACAVLTTARSEPPMHEVSRLPAPD